jgi:hypothetical protein
MNQFGLEKPLSPKSFKKALKKLEADFSGKQMGSKSKFVKKNKKADEPTALTNFPAYFNKRASDMGI